MKQVCRSTFLAYIFNKLLYSQIIDGSEERLTEEQVEEILKIAAKHFNLVQVKEEAADT